MSRADRVCGPFRQGPSLKSALVVKSLIRLFVRQLWDLSSRTLLTTFMFPQPISCLAWETTERLFFAASSEEDGSIYQMNLFRQMEDKSKGNIVEAVGGGGLNDVIRVMNIDESSSSASQKKRLITVG